MDIDDFFVHACVQHAFLVVAVGFVVGQNKGRGRYKLRDLSYLLINNNKPNFEEKCWDGRRRRR